MCTITDADYSLLRKIASRFTGKRLLRVLRQPRQPEERPLNALLSDLPNLWETLAFAKPHRAGQGSLGLRPKTFRDRLRASGQSLWFGWSSQTPLKKREILAPLGSLSGFATGSWRGKMPWLAKSTA